ncbi:MAG: hypothetical protein N2688_01890 [Burkholderiaceae bacterium]|nr:hypothetical protein [Burkholderiaceae bacterium]
MSVFTAFEPWLRRWRRMRLATAEAVVGAQWLGAELALARVRADARGARLDAVALLPAPPEGRGAAVQRALADGILRGARLIVLLSPGQYDLHQIAAPAVPDEELREALRWQLRAQLAYPPEEAVLDFIRLPHGGHGKQPLLVFTAHRPTVQTAVAPFVDHDLDVAAVDVPEFAQRNLALRVAGTGSSAWIGFERDTCLLTAHSDGELAFARRMLLPGAPAADGGEAVAQYLAERIATQTQRSLDLFERQSGLPPVARIVLAPHAHAATIAAALAERTGVSVQGFDAGDVFVDGGTLAVQAEAERALAALGAALRPETGVPA